MHTTQYPDLFVTYRGSFKKNTGKKPIVVDEDLSFSQKLTSSPLVCDSVEFEYIFPPFNDSNSFGTVHYDAHIITKTDYSNNNVFKSMTIQELNTLYQISELERTHLLAILPMSVQKSQLAVYLLTVSRSNFLNIEGSTASIYYYPQFPSPLY